jgi:PAS domain S-box-containing protein
MTLEPDESDGPTPWDEELGEHAATYATMLRAAAERWRFRAQAGRLGAHRLDGSMHFVGKLEAAAGVLEGRPAQGNDHSPAAAPSASRVLEESEERFRLLVDSVKDYAIFMLDPQGHIVSWNPGAERINGYRAEEVIGKHFSIFYRKEALEAAHPQHELAVATSEGRYEEEGWRVRKDGSLIWVNVVLTALRDGNGRLRGFAKVTRDFTERKRTEEVLRQSEERFRLMIEGVKDYAIFMLDPDGRIATWNEGARRAKGYEASEIIGKHFSIFYTKEAADSGHPMHELEVAVKEGRYEEEGWRVRKDGSHFWANVLITAVRGPSGELLGFTKVTRDLTEKRAAQQALQKLAADLELRVQERTEELLAANRELEAFSYSVSHDLRAPLRGLDGFSKMLLASAAEKLNPEERDHLQRVRAAAQRMSQLIDDMLDFSRLSRAPLATEAIDLSALAEQIVADLRQADTAREVDVVIAPGLRAEGDPRLLRVVLENLLGNAWKFTRKQPEARIEMGRAVKDGRTTLFVRDNGAGFDMKYAGKLFMPFQRLHSSREFEGTGIGLATVNRIIQRHGGNVWAESAPEKGTTFTFTLQGLHEETPAARRRQP